MFWGLKEGARHHQLQGNTAEHNATVLKCCVLSRSPSIMRWFCSDGQSFAPHHHQLQRNTAEHDATISSNVVDYHSHPAVCDGFVAMASHLFHITINCKQTQQNTMLVFSVSSIFLHELVANINPQRCEADYAPVTIKSLHSLTRRSLI